MSTCQRCGAEFHCAMADAPAGAAADDATDAPCWCTFLPPVVPVPGTEAVACWCPACLRAHIASLDPAHGH